MRESDSVLLIVSIDTEEDNWYRSRDDIGLTNIVELRRLAAFFERLGVRPTYFTTYQVARDPRAAEVLREVSEGGRAEIGAHLHPWNTPPVSEAFVPRNSMVKNLPAELQLAKVARLTAALEEAFGHPPRVFRAGRYGLGPDTVAALVRCGYRVDSSVTPFFNWEHIDDGPTFFGAPFKAYPLAPHCDPRRPSRNGEILEIPLSCGFSRGPVTLWERARRLADAAPRRRLRLAGQTAVTGLFKRIALSPELASAREMLRLTRRLLDAGVRHLQLCWHSPSLKPGLSPYTATPKDVAGLYASVEAYLGGLSKIASPTVVTMSEAAKVLGRAPGSRRSDGGTPHARRRSDRFGGR